MVATLSQHQARQLAERQAQLIENNLLTAKQHELQDQVKLALRALVPLNDASDDAGPKRYSATRRRNSSFMRRTATGSGLSRARIRSP